MTLPLQLVILTPGFPKDEQDTSCIPALQDFVLGWKETLPENAMRVITFQYPHTAKSYSWHSIPVYAAGGHDRTGISRLMTWLKVMHQLFLLKRKKQTVLISYFLTEASFIAQRFSQFTGMQHLAIAAGQDVKKTNSYLARLNFKKLMVVVFNEKMKHALQMSTGKIADAVIPMGVFHQPAIKVLKTERPIDILTVGSLSSLKQIDSSIRIIASLKNEFPKLKAEIIGKGKERVALEQLAAVLQLQQHIFFSGAVSREIVRSTMQQAKVLLHTSNYEGQSTVISEALEAGMYVVCFDVGRIMDHPKIKVCATATEMETALKEILTLQKPDFSFVDLFKMSETVKAYRQFLHF